MLKNRKKFNKTWIILLAIAAVLFAIVGMVMVVVDRNILMGSQYLIDTLLFLIVLAKINRKELVLSKDEKRDNFFYLGFIFMVIGLNINPGVWGVGVLFFLAGLFYKK